MPCYDPRDADENKAVEAMLCATLTLLENTGGMNQLKRLLDWKEAGITQEWFEDWWERHKRYDSLRRPS